VTLRVEGSRVPIAHSAKTLQHAFMDGEDFELLFAVGPHDVGRVPRAVGSCPITRIGHVVRRGVGVELEQSGGRVTPLVPTGFTHF